MFTEDAQDPSKICNNDINRQLNSVWKDTEDKKLKGERKHSISESRELNTFSAVSSTEKKIQILQVFFENRVGWRKAEKRNGSVSDTFVYYPVIDYEHSGSRMAPRYFQKNTNLELLYFLWLNHFIKVLLNSKFSVVLLNVFNLS